MLPRNCNCSTCAAIHKIDNNYYSSPDQRLILAHVVDHLKLTRHTNFDCCPSYRCLDFILSVVAHACTRTCTCASIHKIDHNYNSSPEQRLILAHVVDHYRFTKHTKFDCCPSYPCLDFVCYCTCVYTYMYKYMYIQQRTKSRQG